VGACIDGIAVRNEIDGKRPETAFERFGSKLFIKLF
jgi:hypothetical protein